jgi:hypothetical protein
MNMKARQLISSYEKALAQYQPKYLVNTAQAMTTVPRGTEAINEAFDGYLSYAIQAPVPSPGGGAKHCTWAGNDTSRSLEVDGISVVIPT